MVVSIAMPMSIPMLFYAATCDIGHAHIIGNESMCFIAGRWVDAVFWSL